MSSFGTRCNIVLLIYFFWGGSKDIVLNWALSAVTLGSRSFYESQLLVYLHFLHFSRSFIGFYVELLARSLMCVSECVRVLRRLNYGQGHALRPVSQPLPDLDEIRRSQSISN